MTLKEQIEDLANKSDFTSDDRKLFEAFKKALRLGEIRAAEKDSNGNWFTNAWVKQGILLGFKMGGIIDMSKNGESFQFFDKETYPLRPNVSGRQGSHCSGWFYYQGRELYRAKRRLYAADVCKCWRICR